MRTFHLPTVEILLDVQAGLFKRDEPESGPFCGGSLIHPEYVITAAHCEEDMHASDILVSFGDFDWTRDSVKTAMPPQLYYVHDISEHKCYHRSEIGIWNDLAILQLKRPAGISERIQVIRLAEEGETFEGEIATVTGWGDLSQNGPQSGILQGLEVEVNKDPFPRKSPSDLGALRAGNGVGTSVLQGDSGAPLSMEKDGEVRLIGVLSGFDIDDPSYGI